MLTAIDTNIVIRLIVEDDPRQLKIVEALLKSHQLAIPHTVLLETEWVLRSFYRWSGARINQALTLLLDLENVSITEETCVRTALARHAAGADFADMMHLATSAYADRFVTFDASLQRHAAQSGDDRVELLA